MTRDLARMERTQFDALVVGAGIYGLALAWELTSRGASVAIVDRGDFGGATTSNSLKTLHGGIRSLQHGALGEMRRFVRERRALATIAPHLVRPLAFTIPTTRHPLHSKAALGSFLTLYDLLTRDRNTNVAPTLRLPPSRILSRAEARDVNPLVDQREVTGAAVWYDYQMRSSERVALAFLQTAVYAGACAANYAEAGALLREGSRVVGARVTDLVSGTTIDLRARAVINAAGPWAWSLLDRACVSTRLDRPGFSKAMNFVVRPVTTAYAVGGLARGRFVFIVPWREYSIAGTSHHPFTGSADTLDLQCAEVRDFLDEVQTAFPGAALTARDIRLVHRGLLPARPRAAAGHDELLKDSIVYAHQDDGTPGLFTVMGVRYTTARETAERAADRILPTILDRSAASRTVSTPLHGGDIVDIAAFERSAVAAAPGFNSPLVRRLVAQYGSSYGTVLKQCQADPRLAEPLGEDCPVTAGEILHAVRDEMAIHLSDAVLRRTDAASAADPGRGPLEKAAAIMAPHLGWSEQTMRDEIADVERLFRLSL
ncbi:MAG TPA: FAD-dependent oxidoreductase [Vicinamibacterales bacterium]|nr:FAD-dependent oxidoreductase [Vicinamibacterales bacterium]